MRRNGKIAAVIAFLLLYLLCSMEINTGDYLLGISKYEFLSPGLMYIKMSGSIFALFMVGFLLMRLRRPIGVSGAVRAIPAVLTVLLLVPIACYLLYMFGFLAMWSLPNLALRIGRAMIRPAPLIGLLAGICLALSIPKRKDD